MPTLIIDDIPAFSYATVEYADDYLVFDPSYASWAAFTNDEKARFLVTATRFLDTLNWAEPWDTQEKREAESKIVQATVVLASMVSQGEADFISTGTTSTGIKSQKAGSVQIEYFGGGATVTVGNGQLPSQLWALLKEFLAGANSNLAVGFLSFGTCGRSANREKFGLTD